MLESLEHDGHSDGMLKDPDISSAVHRHWAIWNRYSTFLGCKSFASSLTHQLSDLKSIRGSTTDSDCSRSMRLVKVSTWALLHFICANLFEILFCTVVSCTSFVHENSSKGLTVGRAQFVENVTNTLNRVSYFGLKKVDIHITFLLKMKDF